ncbi:DUF3089 domain-containing protein [Aquihabitans sp. G128]|uniref:DUF3089 domain-containing protein n=1 Tax=Aquihabitans sp. G128 TaxID=2849779 RepID=UPI001C211B58|nr:DUF3089 domain-containing protein [Aquihabitans sp. G128]QXC60414.1 DUF3089 domain-containing protein [Aquihabitans sp. G128]
MGTTRTVRKLAAVVAVAALGLGACSSDGSDGARSRSATTAADGAATTSTTDAGGGGDRADGTDGTTLERYADYRSKSYDDPAHWLCRPDATDGACDGDLDTTIIQADGTTSVERFTADPDAPIDCFYVYPTISRDETPFSDWDASPDEEGYVTQQQAARLGSVCRVFAPVYRQATLPSLLGRLSGKPLEGPKADPFADVLDAFRTYLAEDNHGRGFVLLGHSQGAGLLDQLIRTEVDPHEDVRGELVGAYLAGTAVGVPAGKAVGGDFQHVPLCSSASPTGCVTTWSSFRSTAPPPASAYFGKPRGGGEGLVAGCVSPADGDDLHAYLPADTTVSILGSLGGGKQGPWLPGAAGDAITTPFVSVPGLVSGRCTERDGFRYLEVTVHGDPADPRADDIGGDLTPEWGLHLVDVSLTMGDIVDRVREQAAAHR